MTRLLLRLPWFLSAPAIVALAVALAVGAHLLLGDYFERSFLDEADPLAAASTVGGRDGFDEPAPRTPLASHTVAPASVITAAATGATPASQAGVLSQGALRDGAPGHNGEGTAKVLRTEDGALFLRFEDFSVTNGPDLFVVLSPDDDDYADGSLNLGGLRATDGNINYEIPEGTDLTQYKSAVIWCRSFNTTFAYATLEVP